MRVTGNLLALLATGAFLAASAANAEAPARRDFGASGTFLNTITGSFLPGPVKWVRQPTLNDLVKSLGGRMPQDFGLSFNCAVEPSGQLRDCHTVFMDPAGTDGTVLTRAITPLLRLDAGEARLAVDKEYRVTVNAALQTLDPRGMPVHCLRPMCVADVLAPPPPPAQAQDPLVREQMKAANDCFSAAWDRSSDLRFAADKAVRDNDQQPAPESVRRAVLDYVNSRTELKKCMAMLTTTAHSPTITPSDRKVVASLLDSMEVNYAGQTRFEVAILIGMIDKRTGEAQLEFPGDWP